MNRITRRRFLIGSGALLSDSLVHAQPHPRVRRIAYFGPSKTLRPSLLQAFRDGLLDLGYVEGDNLVVEYRWNDGMSELEAKARELIATKPEVVVASITPVIDAVRKVAGTTPIVMLNGNDPVELGYAESLAHPGGNITGLVRSSPELIGKNLELLVEAVPGIKRIGVLFNPSNRANKQSESNLAKAAHVLGLQYQIFYAREVKEIEPAIKSARTKRLQALLVMGDGMYFQQREQIAKSALTHRLPSSYANTEHVEAGGLLSYSPSSLSNYRRGASFVDKILRGAKPGDIPIEQPAKFDLVVNVKTAKALGLAIPQSILLRADEVVE